MKSIELDEPVHDSADERGRWRAFGCLVMVFVGLLGAPIALEALFERRGHGNELKYRVRSDFTWILSAAEAFREDHDRWPVSLEELLDPPASSDGSTTKYLRIRPLDPWSGKIYTFEAKPEGWGTLTSYGADQEPGGRDMDADIVSDEMRKN